MILGAMPVVADPAQRNFWLLLACLAVLAIILYKVTGLHQIVLLKTGKYDFGEVAKANIFKFDPIAKVLADEAGNIIAWNDAAELLLQWSESEIDGKPLTTIIPDRDGLREAHTEGMRRFRLTRRSQIMGMALEMPALRKDNTEVTVKLTIGCADIKGRTVYVGSMQDVTKKAEETAALHQEINMLELSERLGGRGSFIWDVLNGGKVHYSKNFHFVFDWVGIVYDQDTYVSQIHPDDRPKIETALNLLLTEHKGYEITYRAFGKGGIVYTYYSKTHCQVDKNNAIVYVAGTLERIS